MSLDSLADQIAVNLEIARSAISQYDFNFIQLELLGHLENTTFKLSADKGNFLLRVHRGVYCTHRDIESEAKIIEHLRRCNSYRYQKPIRNCCGDFVSIGEALGTSKPVSILSWIDHLTIGHDPDDLSLFKQLGQLIAHIHNALSDWQKPVDFQRPFLEANGLLGSNGAYGIYCH